MARWTCFINIRSGLQDIILNRYLLYIIELDIYMYLPKFKKLIFSLYLFQVRITPKTLFSGYVSFIHSYRLFISCNVRLNLLIRRTEFISSNINHSELNRNTLIYYITHTIYQRSSLANMSNVRKCFFHRWFFQSILGGLSNAYIRTKLLIWNSYCSVLGNRNCNSRRIPRYIYGIFTACSSGTVRSANQT